MGAERFVRRARTGGCTLARLVLSITIGLALSGAGGVLESSSLASGSAIGAAGVLHKAGGKLSPRLVLLSEPSVAASSPAGQARALGLPASGAGSLLREAEGRVVVYARVSGSIEVARGVVAGKGAKVVNASDRYGVLTLAVPPSALQTLGSLQELISITEALTPEFGGTASARTLAEHGRAQACSPIVTEGDHQLKADTARSVYAVDGTGVTVGVLSDSYNHLGGAATDVSNGELPGSANPCGRTNPVTVLADYTGGEDEGRAMLQVVHDLAPGASLAFATADNGLFDFADQIRQLRDSGAKVITDDVGYYAEPMFQEGPVGVAINDVVSSGVTYTSSAANSNFVVGGKNVASYEAPAYRPATCPSSIPGYEVDCHDFNPGTGADTTAGYTLASGGSILIDFQWAQPWYGVTTDLDLYLIDATTGTIVALSESANVTTGVPFELAYYQNTSGSAKSVNVVIGRYAGSAAPRLKYVLPQDTWNVTSVEYNQSSGGDVVGPSIWGHNGGEHAISTAAVPYDDSTTPESYTSHGPVTFYFGPVVDTTPAAPLGSPLVLPKPELAATDCGANSFFGDLVSGTWRFCGTSAAAPHAAAVAALLLQKVPSLTPAAVLSHLQATAHPVGSATSDVVGAGLVDAAAAMAVVVTGPEITGFTPTSGPVGTGVTITGSGFSGATAVKFHGTDAQSFTVDSGTQINAVVAAGTTSGTISVTTPGGTATSSGSFTLTSAPSDVPFGNMLMLDGVDDYANAPDSTSLDLGDTAGEDFTIEAFFNVPDAAGDTNQVIFWKQYAYALTINFSAAGEDTVVGRLWLQPTGPGATLSQTTTISPGWHHIAQVFDNEWSTDWDRLAVYLDGALLAYSTAFEVTPGINNSANTLSVGANSGAAAFGGWLEEARFSDSVRYSGETYAISPAAFASDSHTRALWHFDEAAGATSFGDSSGNGNMLAGQNGAHTINPGGPGNTEPAAVPGASATAAGTPVTVTLHGSDAETCNLSFAITTPPAHGGLGSISNVACVAGSPNTDTATVVYTPAGGYSGSDSFSFSVTDGGGLSSTATISLTVNPASAAAAIKSFKPTKGVAGTRVTITGTNLVDVTGVAFSGVPAPFSPGTKLVAQVPAGASVGTISVTTLGGTATSSALFFPLPQLSGASPASAQAGDTVTLTGTNLLGATTLLLGKLPVSIASVDSATQIRTGPLPDGALTGSLVVTTPGGKSKTYKLGVRPTISSCSAYSGAAGLVMTMTGQTFTGTKSVTINGAKARFKVISPTQLSLTVPDAATTGQIAVTNAGGTTWENETFTVAPGIKSFRPTKGAPGTLVRIKGSGFSGPVTVQFNGVGSVTVTVVSATEVDAIVPFGATTGLIRVTTPYGTATSTTYFFVA